MVLKVDILIGVMLAVAVVGSVVGTIAYDEAGPSSLNFSIAWQEGRTEVPTDPQSRTANGEVTFNFGVAARNQTQNTVHVTVTASGGPRPDARNVRVEVTPPGMNMTQKEASLAASPSTTASVDVPVGIGVVPNATAAEGHTLAEAEEAVNATYGSSRGVGTWQVKVIISGGNDLPLAGAPQYTITVRTDVNYYTATVTLQTPDINR